jgi:hypothetical protein
MAGEPVLGRCNATGPSWPGSYQSACLSGSNSSWNEELCGRVHASLCEFPKNATVTRPSELEIWGYGGLFVLLVSLSSVVGVLFLPLMKRDSYKKVLMGMVGLAVGCLCGSAILHLIPQAFRLDGKQFLKKKKDFLNF